MPYRAVLFDLDGVLVKSEDAWFKAVEEAGRRFRGRPISRGEFAPTFGQGTAADVVEFGLKCSSAELDAFYLAELPRHVAQIWVNPQARVLLEAVRQPRALVTNTIGPLARVLLEHAGLSSFFGVLATADRVEHGKPAPDLVQLACRELQVAPREAVLIGDSRFDREAARAAGTAFIGLGIDGDLRVESLDAVTSLVT